MWVTVVLLLALLMTPGGAVAHPHVFVDHAIALLLQGDTLAGLELTWVYDELNSEMLLQAVDANHDRKLSPAEVVTLDRKYLQTLREDGFFVTVRVDGKPWAIRAARDLRARVDGDKLTLVFTTPIEAPLAAAGTIEVRVDDPTYFVAFALQKKDAVTWRGADPRYTVSCTVQSNPRADDFEAVRCAYRRRAR
jgi:ABC-type uncharacterized transport system substrate-binding protein